MRAVRPLTSACQPAPRGGTWAEPRVLEAGDITQKIVSPPVPETGAEGRVQGRVRGQEGGERRPGAPSLQWGREQAGASCPASSSIRP